MLISFIVILSIILFGIVLGYFYSLLPGHYPQKNKQACENAGGEWSDDQNICFLASKKPVDKKHPGAAQYRQYGLNNNSEQLHNC